VGYAVQLYDVISETYIKLRTSIWCNY